MLTELRLKREHLAADATAGITFAVVNIPQAMANALLATVNPIFGLYTLMIATPVGAIFTGSVYMNVSTTSALSIAAGDALAGVPESDKAANMAMLVLLIGLVQLVAGLFKLGKYLRFVSNAVMVGFINGIALLIILGQIGGLTGYDSRFSTKIFQLADTILHLDQIDWATLAIGLLMIALILGVDRTRYSKISFIVALFVCTALVQLLSLESVAVVGDIAETSGSLANLSLPDFRLVPNLVSSAVAVAIIGLVQGAGVSQSYPNPDGKYPDSSRDFSGQGLANIATSFFQGIPAGGSMSGTALVVNTGGVTRWANILAGIFVIPLVLIFSGLINLIPMSALAGLLIVVGFQSLKLTDFVTVWQTGQVQRVAMGLTLLATLTVPLQTAVFVGVAVSILLHVFQSSNRVRLVQFEVVSNGFPIEREVPEKLEDNRAIVLMPYGSLFFAAAAQLEEQWPEVGQAQRAVVILIMRGRDEIGSTFIGVVQRYAQTLAQNGGRLMLAGVGQRVWDQLSRTGTLDLLGVDNVFREEPQLGLALNRALETADTWLEIKPGTKTPTDQEM
jgi:SulP family sulfate permease